MTVRQDVVGVLNKPMDTKVEWEGRKDSDKRHKTD